MPGGEPLYAQAPNQAQPDFSRRASIYSIHRANPGDPCGAELTLLVPEPTVPAVPPRFSVTGSVKGGSVITSHMANGKQEVTSEASNGRLKTSPAGLSLLYAQIPMPSCRRGFFKWIGRPILPPLHVLLVCSHLGLAIAVPVILVSNMVQPLVLWLILVVVLILQMIYLLPGLVLEFFGIFRGERCESRLVVYPAPAITNSSRRRSLT